MKTPQLIIGTALLLAIVAFIAFSWGERNHEGPTLRSPVAAGSESAAELPPSVLVKAVIAELSDNDLENIRVEIAQVEGGGAEAGARESAPVQTPEAELDDSSFTTVDLRLLGPDGLPFQGEVLGSLVALSTAERAHIFMAGELSSDDPAALTEEAENGFIATTTDADGRLRLRLPRRPDAGELLLVIRNPLGRGIAPAISSKPGARIPFEALTLTRIKLPDIERPRIELGRVDIRHRALLATGRVICKSREVVPVALEISAWPKDQGLFGEQTITLPLDAHGGFRIFAGSSKEVTFAVTPILRRGQIKERGQLSRIVPGDRNVEITIEASGRLQAEIDLGLATVADIEFRVHRRDDPKSIWMPLPLEPDGRLDTRQSQGNYDALLLYRGIEVGRVEGISVSAGDEQTATRLPYMRVPVERTRPAELIVLDREGRPLAGLVRIRVEQDGLQNYSRDHRCDEGGLVLVDVPRGNGPWRVVAETLDGQSARVEVSDFPLVLRLGRR